MSDLPTPESLAGMVTHVTESMFGLSFGLSEARVDVPFTHSPPWRTAILPIEGRSLNVAIASDPEGGAALSSAMFCCEPGEVDDQMLDESLSELVNIVAGQVKQAMGIDEVLGLPSILAADDANADPTNWRAATLQNDNTAVKVWVAITEQAAP